MMMNRRIPLPLLFTWIILTGIAHTQSAFSQALNRSTDKPNIILVITDDQGMGDLACMGNPFIKTPNLDEFYNESFRFTDYHVSTTCAPTRGSLMTGRHTNRVKPIIRSPAGHCCLRMRRNCPGTSSAFTG
jgi:hypothetical protein